VYTELADSSSVGPQFVSLPTSLPSGSKYLISNLTSSIFVAGNAIRDVEQWINPIIKRQFETIRPYIESNQYEQDLKTTSFYQTGSSLDEFGFGFLSKLDSKTKISINIPVVTPVQMQPNSASIYYLNSERGRFEEIASSIRHRPWANINFWETRLFNHLGSNVLSSSKNDVLQLGHILNTPTEGQTLPISYLQDNLPIAFSNMGRLLNLVNTQSALIDSNFEATSSQYIQMSRFISQPFMVEKVIMEIPIKAGPGWLRDYTRFVRLNAINGYRNDPFDTGGPAVTFGLINQINRNNRDLILSATIIPENDNFIGQDVSPLYNERFASGFKSYGQPALVIPSSSNQTFTGTLKFQLEPRISNGVTSLGFYCVPGPYSLYGSNRGDKLRNSFAISVNPFGRSMRGVAAGRSVFGKEFSVPDGDGISALARYFPAGIGSYCDVYLYNYEQNAVSPYILFPSDKLVLSVSKYRSCVSQSAVDGTVPFNFNGSMNLNRSHDIWMDTGSIRITMYGSMIREGVEHHDTLNSRLDTNAIHESIHNLIVDEWDVGSIQEFTGSTNAHFMSGTTAPFLNRSQYQWSRRRLFDSTDFNFQTTFTASSIYASDGNLQYWERAQFFRNTQVISEDEQFFDSMIPRIDEISRVENVISPYNSIAGSGSMVITLDYTDFTNSGYALTDWTRSFPFEPKYSQLVRTKFYERTTAPRNPLGYYPPATANPQGIFWPVDEQIMLDISPKAANDWTGWGEYRIDANGFHVFCGLRYKDLINILYGTGGGNNIHKGVNNGTYVENTNAYYGSTCAVEPRRSRRVIPSTAQSTPNYAYDSDGTGAKIRMGSVIRGWKYGLINGYELQTKTIFRRDRYGQYRDMLEQRLDSKFHNGKGVLSSPVNVKFIGPNGSTVSPENTVSSNLSFEATSSLPYFDGIVRNREEPLYLPSIYSMRFTR
jgi:hypothetical protein